MNSPNGIYLDTKVGGRRKGGMTKEETAEWVRQEEESKQDGKKHMGSKGGVCYQKA